MACFIQTFFIGPHTQPLELQEHWRDSDNPIATFGTFEILQDGTPSRDNKISPKDLPYMLTQYPSNLALSQADAQVGKFTGLLTLVDVQATPDELLHFRDSLYLVRAADPSSERAEMISLILGYLGL